ncbi:MAG: PIG-L deacetylase family protein [Candidatus Brocadiales bacterium]
MHKDLAEKLLSRQRLLVLAPHSDDESLGCAGLIAKVKDMGGEAYVMVMSIGSLEHYGVKGVVQGQVRRDEFLAAAKFLKLDGYDIVYKDDSKYLRLDAIPRRDLVSVIERDSSVSIDKIRPTLIALPAPSYNQDHAAVFYAGFTACRPALPQYKTFQHMVVSYECPTLCWSSDKVFQPNFYVDISGHLDRKLGAIRCHSSQLKEPNHNYSLENIERLARLRGSEISVEAAEAFVCYRMVI